MKHPTLLNIFLIFGILCSPFSSFSNTSSIADDRVLLDMSNVFIDDKNQAIFRLNLKVGDMVSLKRLKPYLNNTGKGDIHEVEVLLIPARNKAGKRRMIEKRPIPINTNGIHELIVRTKGKKGIQVDFKVLLLNAAPLQAGTSYKTMESSNIFVGIKDAFGKRDQIREYGLESYRGKFPTMKIDLEKGDVLNISTSDRKGLTSLKYNIKQLAKEDYMENFQPVTIQTPGTYWITFFLEIEDIDKKGWFGIKGKQKIAEVRALRSFSNLVIDVKKAPDLASGGGAEDDGMSDLINQMGKSSQESNELMAEMMRKNGKAQSDAMKEQQEQQEAFFEKFFTVKKELEIVTPLGDNAEINLSPKMALNANDKSNDCSCRKVKWDADATLYIAWIGVGDDIKTAFEEKKAENSKTSMTGAATSMNDFISEAIKDAYKDGSFSKLRRDIQDYYPSHEQDNYKKYFSEMAEFALVDEENKVRFEQKQDYVAHNGVGGFIKSNLTISQPANETMYLCARNNNLYTPVELFFIYQPFKVEETEIPVMGGMSTGQ